MILLIILILKEYNLFFRIYKYLQEYLCMIYTLVTQIYRISTKILNEIHEMHEIYESMSRRFPHRGS